MKTMLLTACAIASCLFGASQSLSQDFEFKEVSPSVFIVSNPESGGSQVVIRSEEGLITFNMFWPAITARQFRPEITKAWNRDDFAYTVNMVDRLDWFGDKSVYDGSKIIGHQSFIEKYQGKEAEVEAEIQRLLDMWRWKEAHSREQLQELEEGSEEHVGELKWMNKCKRKADALEQGYKLVLPTITYDDRMHLDLGNITLELIWFGLAGDCNGMTVAVVPEEKTAIIPSLILHVHHLAPYPMSEYRHLDVPRWIAVLEEVLEGENAVEQIICGMSEVWPRDRAQAHLDYIRRLWNDIRAADAEGKDLNEIQEQFSIDREFAFVKKMTTYSDMGDDWTRPQHWDHVRLFFLQNKILATEMIKEGGVDSVLMFIARIREMRDAGTDIYFEETGINALGYQFMNLGKLPEALEVLKLNVEAFPESANTYDSVAEAYMKNGDRDKAIENYRKSLALNPENTNAVEMLQQLEG